MTAADDLRDELATCTRILAMQGLIGLFGHISVYRPREKTIWITPGSGSDKARLQGSDTIAVTLEGEPRERGTTPPIEWPIHTALHAARADALAVAHLHAPYATLFALAERPFEPITLQGTIFSGGLPRYPEPHLVTTPERGERLREAIGSKRAVLMRGHGIVVVGRSLAEVLYASLILEDEAKKAWQAAVLGRLLPLTPQECGAFGAEVDFERRASRAWAYFSLLESRWDRQPNTGRVELFP